MGIRYSELPRTVAPTNEDLVAILDVNATVLKTATLANAVDCTLGTANISGIGDGTVKGAISYLASSSGGAGITEMTQQQYDALPSVTKNDGHLRLVTSS